MSAKIQYYGVRVPFGILEPKPIVGVPAGKRRLRMRGGEAVRLFVRTETGVSEWALEDKGDHWMALWEVGRNQRI